MMILPEECQYLWRVAWEDRGSVYGCEAVGQSVMEHNEDYEITSAGDPKWRTEKANNFDILAEDVAVASSEWQSA